MNPKEETLLQRLRVTFRSEAEEHLRIISTGLLEAEQEAPAERQAEIVEASFRSAHSLKGAAHAVSLPEIEAICHALESVWASVKQGRIELSKALLERLRPAMEQLSDLLVNLETTRSSADKARVASIVRQLEQAAKGKYSGDFTSAFPESLPSSPPQIPLQQSILPPQPVSDVAPRTEMLRVDAAKLDGLLFQTEELLAVKLAAGEQLAELEALQSAISEWRQRNIRAFAELRHIRESQRKSNEQSPANTEPAELNRFYEFLDWSESFTLAFQDRLKVLSQNAEQGHRHTSVIVDRLLEDVKQIVVQPFSTITESLPRAVRELAQTQGKEVELTVEGGEIEMDRRVLQAMKDPLLHLVRNSIDHGIELPQERLDSRKPAISTLTITARAHGSNLIEIAVADDGRGINLAEVKAVAIKAKLVTPAKADQLNDQELLSFILHSGFSTRSQTTDVSGRGLGLAILRERVEHLEGTISIETEPGSGTTFRILLPLTLANFRGILIEVCGQQFIVPTARVECVVRVERSKVVTIDGQTSLWIDGASVPLVWLADMLELARREPAQEPEGCIHALILFNQEKRIAFAVDRVLEEQEVIVKSLGTQLARVKNIVGATVLGTGRVVLILNTHDLFRSVIKGGGRSEVYSPSTPEWIGRARSVYILVVEDSFISRSLIQNVLEEAGYQVRTAADGLDAWLALQNEEFDMVLSDVEMPRLNGFDLTARIRANPRLTNLPVVLVTALASEDDRRRGTEVGANAYIVKRGFEQQDLLETVARLV